MKKNIAILLLCLLIAALCVRGQTIYGKAIRSGNPYVTTLEVVGGVPWFSFTDSITVHTIDTSKSIRFYKDFTSGLYYRDSAGITRKANTLELSNLNKENHNQKWADSMLLAQPPVWTDTIFCDRIYFDKQSWTVTNSKVAPVPLTLKVVKWIRGVVYPDGLKWFANDGTYYNVIWARLTKSLIWLPIKTYQ